MQKARINPSTIVPRIIKIPGSKSFTNRALLIASLAEGKSILINPLFSDDTIHMIESLKKLGVEIKKINLKDLEITGTGGNFKDPSGNLFVGNSGTTMRFLTALCALSPFKTIITGDKRMKERPIGGLLRALKDLGIKAETLRKNGCPPVKIRGGKLEGGRIKISGEVSSQYISALLMVSPHFKKGLEIEIENELTSRPYIDMTIQVMSNFGVKVENNSYRIFKTPPGQKYKNIDYEIEGDASSAAYIKALSIIHETEIPIENINWKTVQPDIKFNEIANKIKSSEEIDLNKMPDSAMTIAVICAFKKGKTILRNISNLRVKETDRIHALVTEFKKVGVDCEELEDGIQINGDSDKLHGDALIETYNDHRIAMCMSLFATKFSGIQILNPECTKKSYPNFFDDFKSLGIDVEIKKIPNIYLTGMRGSGKSSVGKIIAQRLNRKFIDTDEEIEKQEMANISQIIKNKNWFYFRKKEKYIVRNCASQDETVIATGGGVILDKENVKSLKKNGKIVFLNCPIDILEERIENEMQNRPSLTSQKNLRDELEELWQKRKEKYFSSADLIIDLHKDLSLNEIAQQIISKI